MGKLISNVWLTGRRTAYAKIEMRLDIWSDIVCPWCGIANGHLNRALDILGHPPEIQVINRSFQLMPDFPLGSVQANEDVLRKFKGMTQAQVEATGARMSQLGLDAGFSDYRVINNLVGNTSLAHQFLAYATSHGKHEEAWNLVFREYYENATSIWTVADLSSLAPKLGLNAAEAKSALESSICKPAVEADRYEAAAHGVRSIPFLLVNGQTQIRAESSTELIKELTSWMNLKDITATTEPL